MSSLFDIVKRRIFGTPHETVLPELDGLTSGPLYGNSIQQIRLREDAFDKYENAVEKYKLVIDHLENELTKLRESNRILGDRINSLEEKYLPNPDPPKESFVNTIPQHLLARAENARKRVDKSKAAQ